LFTESREALPPLQGIPVDNDFDFANLSRKLRDKASRCWDQPRLQYVMTRQRRLPRRITRAERTTLESDLTKSVGAIPAADRVGQSMLRSALASGVALSFLAVLTNSAEAYPYRMRYYAPGPWQASPTRYHHRIAHSRRDNVSEPKKEVGFGDMPKGPLQIVVNIGTQKVTLYSNGVRVAQGPVSTGMPGHPTPMGVFSIIEKDRYHHSNIYSGAPMPFMERITWSGVAIHEGVLPGYPASHGCIRMPGAFAVKLWAWTKRGARVIIVPGEISPSDFSHPKLIAHMVDAPPLNASAAPATNAAAAAPAPAADRFA